ncbi:hypothetical protein [Actinomadura sp. 3N407]|uniref:hypothetical protein n=1 Tax=Actinomadura sp. 3N407 TaxID=3457423 RepID=UPI003FCD71FE
MVDGPAWEYGAGDAEATTADVTTAGMTAAGPVRELLLVLARRRTPDDPHEVKVTGDRPLLNH